MKPHPKLRKTIKWGGAVVTVLLVVVWVGSGWITVFWSNARYDSVAFTGGMVRIVLYKPQASLLSGTTNTTPGFGFTFWKSPLHWKLEWGQDLLAWEIGRAHV